jgi:pimeloyl-ACP methyl ester carboxylesterase
MLYRLLHRFRRFTTILLLSVACTIPFLSAARSAACPTPDSLGAEPSRLIVVVPGTGQGRAEWQSFFDHLKKDARSQQFDWLVFDHQIKPWSTGNAREIANQLASCIDEKFTLTKYKHITLIGASMGGMLVRRAYLQSSGALVDQPAAEAAWAEKVDNILLFASVNRGVRSDVTWWTSVLYGGLHSIPHPHFVLEDMEFGSDFIADIRIAWIRYFGSLRDSKNVVPHVVQFWGTKDSIVNEDDNADLQAFSGQVTVRISGAEHDDLQRLESQFAADSEARWALFSKEIFDQSARDIQLIQYQPRRVLIILRGIRDLSLSGWVSDLKTRASKYYTKIEDPDYGIFSAARFAIPWIRKRNINIFRDLYSKLLAENPLSEFDFIGHSNGTYIWGHSMLSTPSMRFNNVVLAAPVLPTNFNWDRLFNWDKSLQPPQHQVSQHQVKNVRYDVARGDIPVGIICSFLNGLGFSDVGPSGVVLFGDGTMSRAEVKKVGWYKDGHSSALVYNSEAGIDNRQHLLNFAMNGEDTSAGEKLTVLGSMSQWSRAMPWLAWPIVIFVTFIVTVVVPGLLYLKFRTLWVFAVIPAELYLIYAVLDTL